MEYRVLGPFEVRVGGRLVEFGGAKPRALLAILLLHRNEVVSADRLIDELWGESPPTSAVRTLHGYVSRLRKALNGHGALMASARDAGSRSGNGVLVTRGHGYALQVAPGELDLELFSELADQGRDALAADRPEEAASTLRDALGLWRGPPLAEFAYDPFAQSAIAQLEELYFGAVEDRVDADLALGRAHGVVGELRDLVARRPLRERLRGQLMLALYRCGRQAEALAAYQGFRHLLSEELGIEPGSGLQEFELAILGREPRLDLPATRAAPARTTGESSIAPQASGRIRRPLFAVAAASLVAAVTLTAVVVVSSGGRASPRAIPGDSVGAISPSGGPVRAVVSLGTSPSAMAAGDGAIWVANQNAGTVARIDPVTRSAVQTVQVGSVPTSIAVGAGAVWVSNNDGGTVSRIDPTVNRVVQTIAVGNAPTGLAVGDGSVWVVNSSDGTLSRIDEISGTVTARIPLGAGATDVAVGADAVWVTDEAGDRVYQVDPQSDQVITSIGVGTGPTTITVGFGSVWVANSLDGTVSRIDPASNRVDATIAVGDGTGALALGAAGIWVANQYAGTVSLVDPATDTVKRTIIVGNKPQGLGSRGWPGVGRHTVLGHPPPRRYAGPAVGGDG